MGRVSELGLLDDVWQRVVTGRRAHLVTILGEPGIGKSRVAAELANQMGASAADPCWCGSSPTPRASATRPSGSS